MTKDIPRQGWNFCVQDCFEFAPVGTNRCRSIWTSVGKVHAKRTILELAHNECPKSFPQWLLDLFFCGWSLPELSVAEVRHAPILIETMLRANPKFYPTRKIFITSSPRWLITLTAMRPDSGRGKGLEVALCSVAQASSSISALRVVFSDL